MYSLIIPVYKNEASIPDLLRALRKLDHELDRRLEVVFVVDGSPDRSAGLLQTLLPDHRVRSPSSSRGRVLSTCGYAARSWRPNSTLLPLR